MTKMIAFEVKKVYKFVADYQNCPDYGHFSCDLNGLIILLNVDYMSSKLFHSRRIALCLDFGVFFGSERLKSDLEFNIYVQCINTSVGYY